MKSYKTACLLSGLAFVALFSVAGAAEGSSADKDSKKSLRVLASPERERRVIATERKVEKETVAFLGVETSPVSATTAAQLGLPRGTGLVVNHVVPKSPADGLLQPHDILLKFDDQILIETRQLSVLIRNHKEGDEVTLTYLRAGQKTASKVKLGKQEINKTTATPGMRVLPLFEGQQFDLFTRAPEDAAERAHVDRLLGMIRRAPEGEPVRIRIEREGGPGFRAVAVHTGNSNLVFSDDAGSLELTIKDGAKSLVAKDSKGQQLFAGPVTTPEERKAMPDGVRQRLEKLEGMHDVTFRTDTDFLGAEEKVVRPRGIVLPLREQRSLGRMPLFY